LRLPDDVLLVMVDVLVVLRFVTCFDLTGGEYESSESEFQSLSELTDLPGLSLDFFGFLKELVKR